MKAIFTLILLLLINCSFYAQVKIGDNPSLIDLNSILELESIDKALVISRMSDTQMLAIQPLKGALVYNTTENCVFVYDGALWKSLCNNGTGTGTGTDTSIKVTTSNTAPTDNGLADFWINPDLNNATSIWDGSNWIALDNNPIKGNGTPQTNVTNPIAGDLYIDSNTGDIYTYNGTSWISSNAPLTADNGLTIDTTNNIQLGGVLIKPTVIQTSAAFTLGITGLEDGNFTTDDIVTVNKTTGQLKKVAASNFFREEVTYLTATSDGEVQFTPNIVITDAKKVNVYRNGVRIDFSVVNSTTIEIEAEAACYSGDQIRIVQFY
ncbi:hypothetical protein [Tenacibaculum salmonis]|uniref:hypothetical protein n=1 Tax=Tenacibaculum sp. P3-BQ1 TaxID=3232310 RepID=UPI0034E02F2D